MTELSRNLLQAAREGLGPDADAAARVRARVLAAVAAPAAVSNPTRAVAAGGTTLKLAAAVVALAVVATGALLAQRHVAAQAPRIIPMAAPADEPASKVHGAASELAPPPAPPVAAAATGPAPRTIPASLASAPIESSVAAAPTAAEPISLAREVELLDRAMLSLRTRDADAALAIVATYERESRGQGQMAEDAAAIAIEAHCALHHEVADRLVAFDRAYPSSAQRERLQTACYGH